ncbi:hypothetical protein WA158_008245 [Blastocystis sp. Blastoise]
MPRHSKNANSRGFVSYSERQKKSLGTETVTYGSDYAKPFDFCSICLHRVVNPMACDEGHIFCKECIYKYILSKKQDYEVALRLWEADNVKREQEEKERELEKQQNILKDIDSATSGLVTDPLLNRQKVLSKEQKEILEQKRVIEKLSSKVDIRTDEEKSLKNIYWVNTPEIEVKHPKPDSTIFCPNENHPIKLKLLTPIHFEEAEENGKKIFRCPACLKQFTHQKIILIKECGHCLCMDCFKKFVSTSKQCFVCSKPVTKKKEFMELITGETGFSAHNTIQAVQYKPGNG